MDLSQRDAAENMAKLFRQLDRNGDGKLEWREVWPVLENWYTEKVVVTVVETRTVTSSSG